jgi:hypothetical protein
MARLKAPMVDDMFSLCLDALVIFVSDSKPVGQKYHQLPSNCLEAYAKNMDTATSCDNKKGISQRKPHKSMEKGVFARLNKAPTMTLWFLPAATMHMMEHMRGNGSPRAASMGWKRTIAWTSAGCCSISC